MTKTPYQAVILSAGRGVRLAEKTDEIPKALLTIGPRSTADPTETCFLRRQIEILYDLGVDQIVVVVGYLRQQLSEALAAWAPRVQLVVNPAPDITLSGSLDSFQCAARSPHGILNGTRQTLLMDADIVYHRKVLELLLEAPADNTQLICETQAADNEEVLAFGTTEQLRFLGKGLTPDLTAGAPCLGEATGIVKFAPQDHALARMTMNWLLGDPDAPEGSPQRKGFGPARRATEHEELSQRFMHYRRMRGVTFGEELPFMEVDSLEEYIHLREHFYPRLLKMEAAER